MNNQQWGSSGGGVTLGSVRQARERMEAGLPPERNLQTSPQNRGIGVAISRPTQVPQWPLAGTVDTTRNQGGREQYQPPAGRANPPQRPPRPSRVPSILDASRLQEHTPTFQYRPQQAEQNTNGRGQASDESPVITSPMTLSSRQSTNSSIGTIPDFPVPMVPPPSIQPASTARRQNGLGPPPSTRRGTSSYYSQASLVSPIPEETQQPQSQALHDSYASSAAIPTTWDAESSRYDDDYDERENMYEGRGYGSGYWQHETIEEGRESRESNLDDTDDRGLIRSASLGKRAKPSMVTTKTPEGKRSSPESQLNSKFMKAGAAAVGVGAEVALTTLAKREIRRETVWPVIGNPDSPLASGTGFIDSRSASSEEAVSQLSKPATVNSNQTVSPIQSGVSSPEPVAPPNNKRLSAVRRPRQIDMDAVRDAEARGSLTSLPDLIRRATRLAAMIDRGKRPGSRLNDLSDFLSAADVEKDREVRRRQSGLSGMLAAFPPPGLATPSHVGTPRPMGSWPAPIDHSTPGLDEKVQKPRRCCGLPVWGFLLVVLLLLIVITAAVVVPVELLVVHKQKSSLSNTASMLLQCQSEPSTQCQNGGSSVLSTGTCSCICINGFTGPTCTVGGTTGCTTTTISSVSNVTLGYSIPRLITNAETNFSIPLSPTVLLSRFSSANLSCVSENALVTFDGQSGGNDLLARSRSSSSTSSSIIPTTSAFFTTPFNSTQQVQDFARVAVLFLLQEDDLDTASTAQAELQSFFNKQNTTNSDALNVTLGNGNSANLVDLSVQLENGTSFGGLNETVSKRDTLWPRSAQLLDRDE